MPFHVATLTSAHFVSLCESNRQLKQRLEAMQTRLEQSVKESSHVTEKYQHPTGESKRLGFSDHQPVRIITTAPLMVSHPSNCKNLPLPTAADGSAVRRGRSNVVITEAATTFRNQELSFSASLRTSSLPAPISSSAHDVTPAEPTRPPLPLDHNVLLSRIDAKYTHCSCLPTEQNLCNCALASIIVQRNLLNCSHQLSRKKRRIRDLKITINAYKIALEGEFGRNQTMVKAFASALTGIKADVTSVVNKSVLCANSSLFPMQQSSDPSVALNQLLLWFYQTMKKLTERIQKVLSSSWSTKDTEDYFSSQSPPIRTLSACHLRVPSITSYRSHIRHSIPDIVPKPPVRLVRRQTARGSQRQIERLRESRSTVEVNFWSDAASTPDSSSSSNTVSPHRHSPKVKVNRWVYNYGDGARLLARVRSMDLPIRNTDDSASLDQQSNLQLLSHMLLKLNELHELVTKQQIVWRLSTDDQDT